MICTLVLIAGIWIDPCRVVVLEPRTREGKERCAVHMLDDEHGQVDATCAEVAQIINDARKQ